MSSATTRGPELSITSAVHEAVRLNLLDPSGEPDLGGCVRAALRGADAALFVVSAVGGLDAVTAQLWARCEAADTPRAVVVVDLDRPGADFDESVALCQRVLDQDLLPLHLPMHDDDGSVAGLIDLLTERVSDHTSGQRVVRAADPEHRTLIASLRDDLVEAVVGASEDEAALDRYLDGEAPEPSALTAGLAAAVAKGYFSPVLAVVPQSGVGVGELLDLLVSGFPSPQRSSCPPVTRPDGSPAAPVVADPSGPLAAQVVGLRRSPGAGLTAAGRRAAYVRVFSGTLAASTEVRIARAPAGARHAGDAGASDTVGTAPGEAGARAGGQGDAPSSAAGQPSPGEVATGRVSGLARPADGAFDTGAACRAGDLCSVDLPGARVGDTLSALDDPLLLAPLVLPQPALPLALLTRSEQVPDLLVALDDLLAGDPTLEVERHPATGQLLLWCLGPVHAEVSLARLRDWYGLELTTGPALAAEVEQWYAVEITVPSAFARSVVSDLAGRRARKVERYEDPEDDDLSTVRAELPEVELFTYAAALHRVSQATGSIRRTALPPGPDDGFPQ